MRTEFRLITPAQAAEWLSNNFNVREADLWRARPNIRGDWKPAHQGIALYPDGSLAGGLGMLTAIVRSGIACMSNVTFDLPFKAVRGVDANTPRPLAVPLGKSSRDVARLALAVLIIRPADLKEAFTAAQVRWMLPFTEPRLAELRAACPTIGRSRSSAPVRLAVMCHAFAAHNEEQHKMFLEQYRAFVTLDYDAMWPSVQTFLRQIDEGVGKDEFEIERLVRAWKAFDPKTAAKMQITNMAMELGEIVTVLGKMTQSTSGSCYRTDCANPERGHP